VSVLSRIVLLLSPIAAFREETSPAPGRHIRSPMGMRSISVGYKEARMIRSAVGAASRGI